MFVAESERAASRRQPRSRKRRLHRHACTSLLCAGVALIVIQGTARALISGPVPEWRDPTFEIKARRLETILKGAKAPPYLIVMTGSSVTCNLFQSKLVENTLTSSPRQTTDALPKQVVAFNMGNHGSGPLTQLVYLKRLLERNVRPDHVVLELSPHLFNGKDLVDIKRFPAAYLSDRDWETIQQFNPDGEMQQHMWQRALFPAYAHRLGILNCLGRFLLPGKDKVQIWDSGVDDRGWGELKPVASERIQANSRLVLKEFEPLLRDFQPGPASLEAFRQVLQLVHDERIAASVLLAPQDPAFRSLYSQQSLKAFNGIVGELCRRYEVQFVNAFDWLEQEMFNDCVHPNSRGADLFSRRLASEVLMPVMR
jgi:hypothetical protein